MSHSSSPADYFNRYAGLLTTIFEKYDSPIKFASIGACDGITDPTIKKYFLKRPLWNAVFVEPIKPLYSGSTVVVLCQHLVSLTCVIQEMALLIIFICTPNS